MEPSSEYEGHYAWISTIEVDTFRPIPPCPLYGVMTPPEITELYVFRDTPYASEYVPEETLVVAPNVYVFQLYL